MKGAPWTISPAADTDTTWREAVVRWQDTSRELAVLPTLSGIDYLRKMAALEVPGAPIGGHFDMDLVEVEPGTVSFICQPNESH